MLVLAYTLHAAVLDQENQYNTTTFKALDCRQPNQIRTSLLTSICGNDDKISEGANVQAIILQRANSRTITGYKCERRVSTFLEICGSFSHSKIFEPPIIYKEEIFTGEDCQKVVLKGMYSREDGTIIPVDINNEVSYSYIKHGKLEHSTSNVYCDGASFLVNGEQISSLLEMQYIHFSVKKITIELDHDGKMKDLDSLESIPAKCYNQASCTVNNVGYYFTLPEITCDYFSVRLLTGKMIQINTETGVKRAIISHEHKTLLIFTGREKIDSACVETGIVITTQYDKLKIVVEKSTITPLHQIPIQANMLDLELESKLSDEYLLFQTENLIKRQLRTVSRRLCTMGTNNLDSAEISPFHPDSLIRVRGDVIQEIKCKQVEVYARLGEVRSPHCFSDALPVWFDNSPLLMLSRTHIITEATELDKTPCSESFQPVFKALDGTLVRSTPKIEIVNLRLTHLSQDFLHLFDNNDIIHESFNTDLLYTSQEIKQFNHLLHFGRTKQRLVDNLVTSYCSNNEDCGQFRPTISNSFNPGNLETQIVSPFSFISRFIEKVQILGQICSILVVLVMTSSLLKKISKIFWLSCFRKHSVKEAIKVSFSFSHQVPKVNNQTLISLPDNKHDSATTIPAGNQIVEMSELIHPPLTPILKRPPVQVVDNPTYMVTSTPRNSQDPEDVGRISWY